MKEPLNLPEDVVAERSLLATIAMGDRDTAAEIASMLEDEDFIHPANRAVFRGIQTLVFTRAEINPLTLKEVLIQTGGMVKVGDFNTLTSILSSDEVGRPKVLAEIIRRKRNLRSMIKLGSVMIERAASETVDPETLKYEVMESMASVDSWNDDGIWDMTDAAMKLSNGKALADAKLLMKVVSFGLPTIDDAIECRPGHLGVIGAGTGVGKSSLMAQAMYQSAFRHRVPTLGISLEMDRPEIESRLLAHVTGLPHSEILRGRHRRSLDPDEMTTMSNLKNFTAQSGSSVGLIENVIRKAARKFGIKSVWIDYFTLLQPPDLRKGTNDAARYGEISKSMKRIAQDLGIHIVLLSQFSRKVEPGEEPSITSLRETGQLENDSNWCVFLWADKEGKRWAKIAKNRSGSGSMTGMSPIPIMFDGARQLLREEVRTTSDLKPEGLHAQLIS